MGTASAHHCIAVATRVVLVSRTVLISPRLRLEQFGDQANVKVRLNENNRRTQEKKNVPANLTVSDIILFHQHCIALSLLIISSNLLKMSVVQLHIFSFCATSCKIIATGVGGE